MVDPNEMAYNELSHLDPVSFGYTVFANIAILVFDIQFT